jgi:ABC-type amino acid transport substrate-binding protein
VFQNPDDAASLLGFEVEIADALARRLGVRAEFVQNDWQKEFCNRVQEGKLFSGNYLCRYSRFFR